MNPTLIGFIAGLSWIVSALLVTLMRELPPFQAMSITWAIATIILAGDAFLQKKPVVLRRPFFDYALVFTGVTMNVVFYYMALYLAPPFEANVLNYLWPIILIALIDISERKPPNIRQLTGMALGFAGCVLLMAGRSGHLGFESFTLGHVCALAAAVTWAGYSVLAKGRSYPTTFMIPIFTLSFLFTLGISLATETWVWPKGYEWLIVLTLGVIRISYAMWDHAVRHGDRVLLTSASYFIPLFSTLLLVLAGFGAANAMIFLAGGFIIAGCLIVNADKILLAFRRAKK